MAIEIERKFLVVGDGWEQGVSRVRHLKQAYLTNNDKLSIRVRIDGTTAALTIKTASAGRQRAEYEYAIPLADARQLRCERHQCGENARTPSASVTPLTPNGRAMLALQPCMQSD